MDGIISFYLIMARSIMYYYYCHFAEEETNLNSSNELPQVIQLVNSRKCIRAQADLTPEPIFLRTLPLPLPCTPKKREREFLFVLTLLLR